MLLPIITKIKSKGPTLASKFQIKQAKNGKLFFNLVAHNGEVILTSQMYSSKATAKKGIASVQSNAADIDQYESKTNKAGEHYFALMAKNNKVIGQSQGYAAASGMKKGIKSVSTNAPKAKIEDINVVG